MSAAEKEDDEPTSQKRHVRASWEPDQRPDLESISASALAAKAHPLTSDDDLCFLKTVRRNVHKVFW